MIEYAKVKRNRRKFLALTGLTLKEFQALLPAFDEAYRQGQAHNKTLVGRKHKRQGGGGRRSTLDTPEQKRKKYNRSGLLEGDGNLLYRLKERARLMKPDFSILIAQPGLSKNAVSSQQLDLLGSTEVYLHEVANASIGVLCSA